jgi:hypothetical protein
VYQFSRAIYRELATDVIDRPGSSANRRALLAACEATLARLASDRQFARPARFLFREVRMYFPLDRLARVQTVVTHQVALAAEFVDQALAEGRTPDGSDLQCHALTRAGKPCQRPCNSGRRYCPSHRHLE